MTNIKQVRRFTDVVIAMIQEDQGGGRIPRDVSSADELDNYVCIDDFYQRIRLPAGEHDGVQLREALDEEIGRRLAATHGGPWHFIWRVPDGRTQDTSAASTCTPTEEDSTCAKPEPARYQG